MLAICEMLRLVGASAHPTGVARHVLPILLRPRHGTWRNKPLVGAAFGGTLRQRRRQRSVVGRARGLEGANSSGTHWPHPTLDRRTNTEPAGNQQCHMGQVLSLRRRWATGLSMTSQGFLSCWHVKRQAFNRSWARDSHLVLRRPHCRHLILLIKHCAGQPRGFPLDLCRPW